MARGTYPPPPVERRSIKSVAEVRDAPDGPGKRIGGLAAIFNRYSRNLGGFIEVVRPPAFNRSRGNGWPGVMARYNHTMLLGTTGAGTLELAVVPEAPGKLGGLDYTVLPPVTRADVLELVQRGDVRHSSFAFRSYGTDGDAWGMSDQGYPLRELLSVEVVDVAPVDDPAYPDATSALRSLALHVDADLREVRQYAAADELRRLIVRTDGEGPRVQHTPPGVVDVAAARQKLLGRRLDPTIAVREAGPRMNGQEAARRMLERYDIEELSA